MHIFDNDSPQTHSFDQGDSRAPVQVVDFFSGCGGMSYGFAAAETRNVRFDLRGAVDIDKHANSTYRRMLGLQPMEEDVAHLIESSALQEAIERWDLNSRLPLLLIGCAPCQGFSSHRKKDSRTDERNGLLEAFGRVAVQLKPDLVIMENVPEMLQERHWHHFQAWHDIMVDAGYNIQTRIYNLAEFGVPQERFRALDIAARDWSSFRMPEGTHTVDRFVTVRQAIGHLRPLQAGDNDALDPMHITSRHRAETIEILRHIPPDGGSRRSLPDGMGPSCFRNVDGFRDVYGRLAWDNPAVAITSRCRTPSCGRFAHPEQHRGLSVREAASLQGFPESFTFDGPFDDKYKQIGNAVSPIFAKAVASHLDHEWIIDHDSQDHSVEYNVTLPITKSFSSSIASIKRRARAGSKDSASVGQLRLGVLSA